MSSAVSAGAASYRFSPRRLTSCAAPAQYIATNSSPLPRKTVLKSWSSRSPIRARTTPMNHRKAIPAKGAR